MRECAFKAGLLNDRYSQNLKVITESEATALFCMENLKTHNISVGEKFIVVECGDDKVNLTTRMLLIDEILSVILEKAEDNCGGSFVYQEFLKFIEHKIGSSAINLFSKRHKPQLQYLQSVFEREFLIPFTGDQSKFTISSLDLEEYCSDLMQYCKGKYRDNMIKNEWVIELKLDDVKAMLDPIIEKIIQLIYSQLNLCNNDCFALIFVGKFANSGYLQLRIKETFCRRVQHIFHIPQNEVPIIKGAVQYGLDLTYDNTNISYKQFQILSTTIKKLEEENNDLTNKYNEKANQHQIIVENLKTEIKEIEEKHSENIQHLENQINDINQQYQNKIKLQEQRESQMQNKLPEEIQASNNDFNKYKSFLEKEKKELDAENDYLYQRNTNLINQLESTSFEDELSNYRLEDVAQNYGMELNNDISKLNDNLKKYITNLKQDVIVNVEEIRKLLLLYKCPVKITNQKDDLLLIQAVLQRHIIETIFSYATKYFQSTGQHYHLESDIINQASLLSTLLTDASKYRTGNDGIMHIASTKLRKQIYSILNNCGFSDIHGKSKTTYEHPFITFYKEKLSKTMNELRTIKDQEKITVENLAATIIREVIKIFWFRLKIHESVVQYVWIPYNAKVNETFMKGENIDDNDNENLYVDLCYFPLIGRDLTSDNHEVYVPAKVFVRKTNDKFNNIK
ncbi:139_t:CDS:2 [Rhizophagus irregularis]|nr:139_t:CDS:2 [Rhizophagus irregularis]